LLGIEFNKKKEAIAATFSPVALTPDGAISSDNRVQFVFSPIGRFIASYRLGQWNDENAKVKEFEPEQIFDEVKEFGQLPIYGWKFIDAGDDAYSAWSDRLSFDYKSRHPHGLRHTIDLFQDGLRERIDMRIWFDDLQLFSPKYENIELKDFINNGKRGWDAVHTRKDVSEKYGIYTTKS
jgi:hypothetical protein